MEGKRQNETPSSAIVPKKGPLARRVSARPQNRYRVGFWRRPHLSQGESRASNPLDGLLLNKVVHKQRTKPGIWFDKFVPELTQRGDGRLCSDDRGRHRKTPLSRGLLLRSGRSSLNGPLGVATWAALASPAGGSARTTAARVKNEAPLRSIERSGASCLSGSLPNPWKSRTECEFRIPRPGHGHHSQPEPTEYGCYAQRREQALQPCQNSGGQPRQPGGCRATAVALGPRPHRGSAYGPVTPLPAVPPPLPWRPR